MKKLSYWIIAAIFATLVTGGQIGAGALVLVVAFILHCRNLNSVPSGKEIRLAELGVDYYTYFMGGAFGINSRNRTVHFLIRKKTYSYSIAEIRGYDSGWMDHYQVGSAAGHFRDRFHVQFAIRDVDCPTIKIPVAGEHVANQVMEWMNQLREGILPQRDIIGPPSANKDVVNNTVAA